VFTLVVGCEGLRDLGRAPSWEGAAVWVGVGRERWPEEVGEEGSHHRGRLGRPEEVEVEGAGVGKVRGGTRWRAGGMGGGRPAAPWYE
jgi:hypothetical protein